MLQVVGMAPTNQAFTLAFCIMENEQTGTYCWALQCLSSFCNFVQPPVLCTDKDQALSSAISLVFPGSAHLLCRWHINKNIHAHCKNDLGVERFAKLMSLWKDLVQAASAEEYLRCVEKVKKFLADQPRMFFYINDTWLSVKEKFVAVWINRYLHLDNIATSRVEGAHAALKSWIPNSFANLRGLLRGFEHHIAHQLREISTNLAFERTKRPLRLNEAVLGLVYRRISRLPSPRSMRSCKCWRARATRRRFRSARARFEQQWAYRAPTS